MGSGEFQALGLWVIFGWCILCYSYIRAVGGNPGKHFGLYRVITKTFVGAQVNDGEPNGSNMES